ncbi:MAG TPA: alpha/beta fold hydrolase [Streptosporangiaceae bacterium]|jgi:pimeloyl-ACP methyl ester carboxylesterase
MRYSLLNLGGPLHVAEFGGTGPPMVLLHGLGGSHANWLIVGERLTRYGRVVCPDLPGFGRSLLAGRSASMEANVRLMTRFLAEAEPGDAPATLVGNSMGATLALHLAAALPERVARLVLLAPWLPCPPMGRGDPRGAIMRAVLGNRDVDRVLVPRRRDCSPEELVRRMLRLGCAEPDRVPQQIVSAATRVASSRARLPDREDGFAEAAHSLVDYVRQPSRALNTVESVSAPALVVHGSSDRVVPPTALDRLRSSRPDWRFETLDGVGHTPHVEAPLRLIKVMCDWLGTEPAPRPRATGSSAR